MPPALLTVAEVAEHLRVSEMTVYRLLKRGDLPARRVGQRWRIAVEDLTAYLEGARVDRAS